MEWIEGDSFFLFLSAALHFLHSLIGKYILFHFHLYCACSVTGKVLNSFSIWCMVCTVKQRFQKTLESVVSHWMQYDIQKGLKKNNGTLLSDLACLVSVNQMQTERGGEGEVYAVLIS